MNYIILFHKNYVKVWTEIFRSYFMQCIIHVKSKITDYRIIIQTQTIC